MRFDLVTRRAIAIAVGPLLALALAACGSGASSSSGAGSSSAASSSTTTSSTTASSTKTSSTTAPSTTATGTTTTGNSGAARQITTNWEAFFDGKTGAATKISLLQNGQKYATVIKAQAGSALASGLQGIVTAVVLNSATHATVSYDIKLNGASALPNQTGAAVLEGGVWKVDDVSFCNLLRLEGATPAVCGS